MKKALLDIKHLCLADSVSRIYVCLWKYEYWCRNWSEPRVWEWVRQVKIAYFWYDVRFMIGISVTTPRINWRSLSMHPHRHGVLVARISLTLSRHSSLSFIALGRSSGQHPVSSHSCWMCVRADCPAFARPCVGVHKSTSLMSSSQLLQQCPACLVCLTWIVFVIGGRWPYNWCLVGCCRQDLFKIALSILV